MAFYPPHWCHLKHCILREHVHSRMRPHLALLAYRGSTGCSCVGTVVESRVCGFFIYCYVVWDPHSICLGNTGMCHVGIHDLGDLPGTLDAS